MKSKLELLVMYLKFGLSSEEVEAENRSRLPKVNSPLKAVNPFWLEGRNSPNG